MASVHWTLGARQELGTIIVQLGQYSPTYAAAFAGRVIKASEQLESFPMMGRMVPEYELDTVHELLIDSYRLIYLVESGEVQVLSLIHASQSLRTQLGDDPRDVR